MAKPPKTWADKVKRDWNASVGDRVLVECADDVERWGTVTATKNERGEYCVRWDSGGGSCLVLDMDIADTKKGAK